MDRRHAAWLDLRDTAGAVRLAVQILDGPLHPGAEPPPPRERIDEVIATLEQATRRLCGLIDELQPAANDPMPEAESAPARTQVLAPAREAIAPAKAAPAQLERRSPRKPNRPTIEPGYGAALDPILRALELHVRAPERAIPLDVTAVVGLRVLGDGDELLRVLVGLVEDAAAPTGATVRLRVWLDPVEDLGDAMDVVFEVRTDGAAAVPRGPGLDAAQAAWGPQRVCVHASPAPGRVLVRVPQAR